jgi:hypothetical protein
MRPRSGWIGRAALALALAANYDRFPAYLTTAYLANRTRVPLEVRVLRAQTPLDCHQLATTQVQARTAGLHARVLPGAAARPRGAARSDVVVARGPVPSGPADARLAGVRGRRPPRRRLARHVGGLATAGVRAGIRLGGLRRARSARPFTSNARTRSSSPRARRSSSRGQSSSRCPKRAASTSPRSRRPATPQTWTRATAGQDREGAGARPDLPCRRLRGGGPRRPGRCRGTGAVGLARAAWLVLRRQAGQGRVALAQHHPATSLRAPRAREVVARHRARRLVRRQRTRFEAGYTRVAVDLGLAPRFSLLRPQPPERLHVASARTTFTVNGVTAHEDRRLSITSSGSCWPRGWSSERSPGTRTIRVLLSGRDVPDRGAVR